MRVSERMRYDQVHNRVERAKSQNAQALDELSSQKAINKLSDSPIGVTQSIRFRDKITDLDQYQKNIDYAQGILERSESALKGIADSLIRAKELAIAMSNDTYAANSREASAREIKELIDEVIQHGNTTFNGRYVFGGFRSQTPPLNLDGEYLGDDGDIYLQVGRGAFRKVNINARGLFQANPDDMAKGHFAMIQTLETLYEGLMTNDKVQIHKSMNELGYQLEKTSSFQATVGGIWNALNDGHKRLEVQEDMSREGLSKVQDADIYKATSEFKRTETVLQSTLLASTKLLQPSLLNFMQ